jgi:hypothetical protein
MTFLARHGLASEAALHEKEKAGSIRGGTGSGGQSSQRNKRYKKLIPIQQFFYGILRRRQPNLYDPIFVRGSMAEKL